MNKRILNQGKDAFLPAVVLAKSSLPIGLMSSFLIVSLFLSACQDKTPTHQVFELLSVEQSGIDFVNLIEENNDFNMYAFMNIYTGGGLAVGDIDNDGLEDIFFSGNRVSSKLYLNKGNLNFEDITLPAGITTDRWCSGASMVDLNQDGWLDIYVSVTGIGFDEQRSNLYFENQGDQTFVEKAEAYGLNDPRQIMHTSFFDYDRDGDLDAYMIVNPVDYSMSNVNTVRPRLVNGESESTDRLYRNDGGRFTDVSQEAGILIEGYSLGIATTDINGDDWPDIYVSNDFLTNDILYLNNQDGTFTNQIDSLLNHTSFAGMGNDVSDINNDGQPDIVVVDMLPEDNGRRQLIIPSSSYDKFQLTQQMNYLPQYTRNTLQLNNGDGSFSEVGQLAGIDKTDWSWSSLLADYDNDGDRDLFITNGFLRDVGNLDYISYQRKNASPFGKKEAQHQARLKAIQDLGAAKIQNYVFENQGDLKFSNRSTDWGIPEKTCSNGAAFADLDQDGDLEMIINNVNDRAFIYENKTGSFSNHNFIKIDLEGSSNNLNGIGSKITISTENGNQYYQHNPYRGYASTISGDIHFGLGKNKVIEKIAIDWPDGKSQSFENIPTNQTISIQYKNAIAISNKEPTTAKNPLFVKSEIDLNFQHQEKEFVDFKVQPLLPHKHSQNGPGISTGDVNGDGLADFYVGGAADFSGRLFLQKADGNFEKSRQEFDAKYEDMGSLFFDADGDNDLDLLVVSGGSHVLGENDIYQDRFYENDGQGNFIQNENAIPKITASGASVSAADFDKDGDLDLFIAGRILPGSYPMPAKSFLLRNDSQKGTPKFIDISQTAIPKAGTIGLVTQALWTDYDNDQWIDLLLVGEWMPITFIKNKKGHLDFEHPVTIAQSSGWWNSVVGGDFDKDGDTDYIAGNLGLNARYQASPSKPVCVYASDYDKNGRIDPVICQYIGEENYIAHPRDLLIQQINAVRSRFKTYKEYGAAPFEKAFTKKELAEATVLKSENFASSYIENLGDGNFTMTPLPLEVQIAPIYGMSVEDVNEDGNLDLLLVGNSFATEVSTGRYDAFKGGVLEGDGTGNFSVLSGKEAGFYVDTDAKGLVKLQTANAQNLYLVANNNGPLQGFRKKNQKKIKSHALSEADTHIIIQYENGSIQKQEIYFGNSYLSQSENKIDLGSKITSIEIFNIRGEKRIISREKN